MTEVLHLKQGNTNLLLTTEHVYAAELSIWDDGSMGDIYLSVGETLTVQDAIDQVVGGCLTLLTDEQLSHRRNAVQAQLDALNAEAARRTQPGDGADR